MATAVAMFASGVAITLEEISVEFESFENNGGGVVVSFDFSHPIFRRFVSSFSIATIRFWGVPCLRFPFVFLLNIVLSVSFRSLLFHSTVVVCFLPMGAAMIFQNPARWEPSDLLRTSNRASRAPKRKVQKTTSCWQNL